MEEFLLDPETWVGVGILIFLGLLVWKKVPNLVAKTLDARANRIAQELDDARKLRTDAEALLIEYQRRTAEVEKEAQAIVSQARAEAQRIATEARAALDSQVERRARIAQEKIARAEAQALAEMRTLAANAAVNAAEKLIAERLGEDGDAKLIRDGIKDLPGRLN